MLLLLGPTGSGKTLLLKRLQKIFAGERVDKGEAPSTVPTVGTNLVDVSVGKRRLTVRELGGTMAPIWNSYYKHSTAVIFVVDVANARQLASAGVQLWEVLAHPEWRATVALCVLLNKTDLAPAGAIGEFRSLLRLDAAEASTRTTSPQRNDDDDDDDDAVVTAAPAGKSTAVVAAVLAVPVVPVVVGRVSVVSGSARDGTGLRELADWIRGHAARG